MELKSLRKILMAGVMLAMSALVFTACSDDPEQAVMYVKVLNEGSISVKLANGQEEIYIASSQKYDFTKTWPGVLG